MHKRPRTHQSRRTIILLQILINFCMTHTRRNGPRWFGVDWLGFCLCLFLHVVGDPTRRRQRIPFTCPSRPSTCRYSVSIPLCKKQDPDQESRRAGGVQGRSRKNCLFPKTPLHMRSQLSCTQSKGLHVLQQRDSQTDPLHFSHVAGSLQRAVIHAATDAQYQVSFT